MRRYLNLITLVLLTLGIYSCDSSDDSSDDKEAQITEKYWKLIAIEGQPLTASEGWIREPHLIFKTSGEGMTGNGGCNYFGGTYELDKHQGLRIGKIGITEMACPDMALENQFVEILGAVTNYNLHNGTLTLAGKDQPDLASFKYVRRD